MGFLSNFKFGSAKAEKAEAFETPVRSRTFSASAYREAELARERETRTHFDEIRSEANNVLTPALAPVAEVLIQRQEQSQSFADDQAEAWSADELVAGPEPEPSFDLAASAAAAPVPQDDPMDWEEAVGWLSQRSAESRNFVAQYWNWDYDLRVLEFLVRQPDVDAGVAAGVFWLTAAIEDYFPWSDEPALGAVEQQVAHLTNLIGQRFSDGDFAAMSHGFDDSWDCERLKERLVDLHGEGRIEWSPADLPTRSHAPMLGFDDIPADERDDVIEFLGRHGVR